MFKVKKHGEVFYESDSQIDCIYYIYSNAEIETSFGDRAFFTREDINNRSISTWTITN